jgi:hypothetical protein
MSGLLPQFENSLPAKELIVFVHSQSALMFLRTKIVDSTDPTLMCDKGLKNYEFYLSRFREKSESFRLDTFSRHC